MRRSKILVVSFCFPLLLLAQSREGTFGGFRSAQERDTALQTEADLVLAAKKAAAAGKDAEVDLQLALPRPKELRGEASTAFLFRSASVCAWLLNEGNRDAAVKVARRTLQGVKKAQAVAGPERVGRLYWEAWLRAEVLGERKAALELLDAAARLAPDDSRIVYGRQRWALEGKGGKS